VIAGAGGVIASILAYLFPRESVRSSLGPRRVRVGRAADIPAGTGRLVLVDEEPVWILNLARGFVGVSAFCTHKSCVIKWEESRRLFDCPCHDGRFDERGNVVSGPPRRPLTHFRVALVGDDIYVSAREERQV
jgi:Rieske Fe-S protein